MNQDGKIVCPPSGDAIARQAGMSRTSVSLVRTNIRRVIIDRPATRGLQVAFNTEGVPGVPATTETPVGVGLA